MTDTGESLSAAYTALIGEIFGAHAPRFVPGEGPQRARLMLIGEAPGEEMGMVAGDKLAIFNSLADCVMELLAGRVDAVVMDTVPAQIYVAQHADELMIVEGLEIPVENYGIAIKKENTELLEKVDAALAEIMASEEYQALLDKYFGA